MYHDRTCSAKSDVSKLFYSQRRVMCLMTVFIYVYMSCPRSKTNKLFVKIVWLVQISVHWIKGHGGLSSLLAARSCLIDALFFPLAPPFCFFLYFCSFAHLRGKTGGRHRKERFLQPCLAARWKNRLC